MTWAGAVYVYKRTGTSWAQEAYLKPSNNVNFGNSVSIDNDTIVVGAYSEPGGQTVITNGPTAPTDSATFGTGAAYVFKRSGTTWVQESYLKAPNAESSDWFGHDVSISGDRIVAVAAYEASNQTTITNGTTASSDNSATNSGACYVFKRTGSTWAHEAYIKAANAEASDEGGGAT
jgi:hypothetical protein